MKVHLFKRKLVEGGSEGAGPYYSYFCVEHEGHKLHVKQWSDGRPGAIVEGGCDQSCETDHLFSPEGKEAVMTFLAAVNNWLTKSKL